MYKIELWKDVTLNNKKTPYLISTSGKVYSKNKDIILKPEIRAGYKSVNIYFDKTRKKCTIHKLVASAFIDN